MEMTQLNKLITLIRYYILTMTTAAGSGHPTSSLSATDLMTVLFFKHFHFDLDHPENPNNDRLIFSKGHASPLFYALYGAAGKITEKELLQYRTFDSNLEGHPTPRFPFTEAATGSLGQGLSIGVGMALAMRHLYEEKIASSSASGRTPHNDDGRKPFVYVLLGDGEMAEGSMWEAMQYAAFQKLTNLVAILDVNRLGQSEQTMLQYDIDTYANRVASFGWQVLKLPDGHDLGVIDKAFEMITSGEKKVSKPTMIIAKTIKGKGYSQWEDKNGWHSKTLTEEQLKKALQELGAVDKTIKGIVQKPSAVILGSEATPESFSSDSGQARLADASAKLARMTKIAELTYDRSKPIPTKKAFGNAIERLGKYYPELIVLDGDVKNSLHTDQFEKKYPQQFLQMYIAEQNMVGVAIGLAKRGFKPWVTTFACFMTRAHDQLRMADLSHVTILFNGSYAGVSLGKDGPSQMGLDDLGMFRSFLNSTVVYPADAVSTERLTQLLLEQSGIGYIRTTREATPVIYSEKDIFKIGGSHTFSSKGNISKITLPNPPLQREGIPPLGKNEVLGGVTIIAAGITLYEALKAQKELEKENISVDVIDCYSIKPIDVKTLHKAAQNSKALITVEDHYREGGLGDAVLEALAGISHPPVYKLAVTKTPRSGKPAELLTYEGIDATAIINKVKSVL